MLESQEKRGRIYRNRKIIAGLVIIFISLQVIIAVLTLPANDNVIPNINVPRSAIPDSCVYPATYDIEYNTSYMIEGDYAPLINVSEETAVDTAFAFLNGYLPEEFLPGLRLSSGDGFWPGSPTLFTDCWPRWGMTFVSNFTRSNVYVNALSGKVMKFTMFSYDTTGFVFEPVESIEEAENLTIDFLRAQNYTLLPDAVYDGASLYSEPVQPYYILTFHQEINDVSVDFGEIYIQIDATYGLIEHFSYKWIELDTIPVDRIIPVEEINSIVMDNVTDSFWIRIEESELCLSRMGFNPDSSEFTMRLVYKVYLITIWGIHTDLYTVDAISGEIVSTDVLF